jgi:UDP-2,4-diacetamido-2,4,6-trideoxy-beta-L-altropyranose hydrolase
MIRLLIRVEANSTIGYGHFTRCLAIAQQLPEFESIVFAVSDLKDLTIQASEGKVNFSRLNDSVDFFGQINRNDIVIIDGYSFDLTYHLEIKSRALGLISIDDLANQFMHADLVLNPTPGFSGMDYHGELSTQYLTGLSYAILRQPFLDFAKNPSSDVNNKNLLICFGGSDPLNKTKTALISAFSSHFFEKIIVVTGPGYTFQEELSNTARELENVEMYQAISAEQMVELMSMCRYGIYPCSSILLEGLAVGQTIISGYYIDNQQFVYQQHKKIGTFIDAGSFQEAELNAAIQEINSREANSQQKRWIDGKSMERIARQVHLLIESKTYFIRKATIQDLQVTFEWANHPNTRKYSFSKDPIPLENHVHWFTNKIQAENCLYLILEYHQVPIGSIRFDKNKDQAIISYLVSPEHHGRGIGTLLMKQGLSYLAEDKLSKQISRVIGYVFEENIPSKITFERFGFQKEMENDTLVYSKQMIAS